MALQHHDSQVSKTLLYNNSYDLTHLPLAQHICSAELGSIGSGNGLSPVRHQTITWTNVDLLSIGHLEHT